MSMWRVMSTPIRWLVRAISKLFVSREADPKPKPPGRDVKRICFGTQPGNVRGTSRLSDPWHSALMTV